MQTLADLTATELLDLLSKRKCSAEEIVESCIERVRCTEPVVRAFVEIDEEGALKQARECDRAGPVGLLHGIPFVVKDTVDVAGLHCSWGTQIHRSRVPEKDAVVVQRLRAAGAVILGTTVTTEYAMAKAGPTTNPHDRSRTPGGSSSGSGAAVAARMVPIAIGTQTLGSIIRPASFCGVFGLKPTFGAVPVEGTMPLSSHLDHVGPMARRIADIRLAFQVMSGADVARADSAGQELNRLPSATRVLRVEDPFPDRIEPPTRQALDRAQDCFKAAGCRVADVELPKRFTGLIECFQTIVFHDMAKNHGADRDRYEDQMSKRFLEIVDSGRRVSAALYEAALTEANYYRSYVVELLGEGTVILAPSTDGVAPPLSDATGDQKLQSLWSVTGVPSFAVPCGKVSSLPIGVQVVAAPRCEDLCLGASLVIESRFGVPALDQT
jgi:Asp-tRNA(Asn)/Glu-tRNA(Gln) amidotransferase A subunit family amidase